MTAATFRRDYISKPIFRFARHALPSLSATEREAIEAGDVWWDGEIFSGNPDWAKLLAMPPAKLTAEEQAFLDGPVAELCAMLDEWRITWELRDLPPQVWDFLKRHKFFAMIIPKRYGGLGFSAYAHSEVIRKLSTRSLTASVTAMVPNSLGPGELLLHFGTKEQQDYWLPRLAAGEEIPCFGLTSPEAGSDAASMIDSGVVTRGAWQGREVLGIRLNWHKRYITLAPVATVIGLAFKLHDPEHLIGEREDIGITVALVPTNLPGVEIGRRHLPTMMVFQNGPTVGRDVFIPLDNVIGGVAQAGKGWKMLMSALAAGRGISLPSLSAAGTAFAAHVTGAYARIREQFHVPIGRFQAIQERLGRMAATAYLLDAARRFTCAGIDAGHKPAVVTAIMKEQATERLRMSANDAMDVHGGKGVQEGPLNYLGGFYRSVPIGITVEGANIVTRSLIQFGQGAIRSHPYLLKEMAALEDPDPSRGLEEFDRAFWGHVGHSFANAFRAWAHAWTGGVFAPAPAAGRARRFYKQLGRYASAFALAADMALLTLGGALKRQEMISARFGDILSELYLLSAVLKRWNEEGRQPADFPLVAWCMEAGFATIETRFDAIFANFPNRPAAWFLRFLVLPFGLRRRGPPDRLTQACAEILLNPSATRERVTADIFRCPGNDGVARLERAFALVVAAQPLRDRLHQAHIRDIDQARAQNLITDAEAEQLRAAAAAVAAAIAVDDFAPEALARRKAAPAVLQATGTIALPRNDRARQPHSAPLAPGDP
ncbi:MAG TPA: acyl-CoA dehydrogenase [Xanthobacteraceae bacterium]|jgi:acyl-CoA dehydrogenase|nr:acyl-CoA dehydrogenase [Xanthobacteraceae bacterium]